MGNQYKGIYKGPNAALVGETALLMDIEGAPNQLKAQFDNIEELSKSWTHGWTIHRRDAFNILHVMGHPALFEENEKTTTRIA